MPHLSELKLSDHSPREGLSPVARKRLKLVGQLDLQMQAAEHALRNEVFIQEVQRWERIEGSNDKQLVTRSRPVRPWWWTSGSGAIMLSLRQGARIMELADGKQSIEVGRLEDLPKVLETIRAAVAAGELDEQLKKSPYIKPVAPTKRK